MKKHKIKVKADFPLYQRIFFYLCLSVVAYLISLGFFVIGFLVYLGTGVLCFFAILEQGNFITQAKRASYSETLQDEAKKALETMRMEADQDLINFLAYNKICFDFFLYTLCLYPLFLFQFDEVS